jgi:hypothetical protein
VAGFEGKATRDVRFVSGVLRRVLGSMNVRPQPFANRLVQTSVDGTVLQRIHVETGLEV